MSFSSILCYTYILIMLLGCKENNNPSTAQQRNKALQISNQWDTLQFAKRMNRNDTLLFTNYKYKKIQLEIIYPNQTNLRIIKILLTNKVSDGPFGKILDYPLQFYGKYRVIIGENQAQNTNTESSYEIRYKAD